jgi:hypothetical protein
MLPEAIAIVMAPTDPTRYINHLCCRHLFVHSTFIFPTFGCIIILILSELYNVRCLFASFLQITWLIRNLLSIFASYHRCVYDLFKM